MNQEEFYLANQVDGQLTDAQTMQMLGLPEGDSTQVQSSVPDAAADAEPDTQVDVKAVEPAPQVTPVLMAKDGVHTIDYQKLVDAREAERVARAQMAEMMQELDALKKAPKTTAPEVTPAEMQEADGDLFGDFSEEAIGKGVEKLVASRTAAIEAKFEAKLNAILAPVQAKQAESATEGHFSSIQTAHPDVESVIPSEQFGKWIDAQPSFVRDGFKAVVEQGTAAQVIEMLDAYKSATGKTAAATAKPSVAAAAQAAIAKAQSAPPMSLSEIPAGSSAAVDEAGALLEMSDAGMMSKFDGKSPEQIMALMNRVL